MMQSDDRNMLSRSKRLSFIESKEVQYIKSPIYLYKVGQGMYFISNPIHMALT